MQGKVPGLGLAPERDLLQQGCINLLDAALLRNRKL
jgi:hypothetical protein